ncbi:MAG: hypothetical protein IT584_00105, partial [Chlamydiae bacterium]|nr:hypothetical protein [Chlamydiota bacterium]
MNKPEWIDSWSQIMAALGDLPELKRILGQPFLTELCHLELLSKHHNLPKLHANNPLFRSSPLAFGSEEHLWERKSFLKDLRDSTLFHLISSWKEVSVLAITL